ncbi:MAG: hypothetical protein LBC20_06405 [Planctomycetaceae bacterium]|nr:hypothetical protein [Planctomycetaceae bacterium]
MPKVEIIFYNIFGLLPKLTWFASIGLFSIFSIISFYKAVSGETSCGCFGAVTVNPWITMTFDLVITGLLMICLPKNDIFYKKMFWRELAGLRQKDKIITVLVIWLVIASTITYAIFSVSKTDFGHLGVEFVGLDGKKVLLLTPEKWIGNEFPLIPYIEKSDIIEHFKNGYWTVILFSHSCEKCKKTLTEFIERKTPNILCIEIPPYGEPIKDLEYVKLNETQKWFADTPVVMKINNLIVERIVKE